MGAEASESLPGLHEGLKEGGVGKKKKKQLLSAPMIQSPAPTSAWLSLLEPLSKDTGGGGWAEGN